MKVIHVQYVITSKRRILQKAPIVSFTWNVEEDRRCWYPAPRWSGKYPKLLDLAYNLTVHVNVVAGVILPGAVVESLMVHTDNIGQGLPGAPPRSIHMHKSLDSLCCNHPNPCIQPEPTWRMDMSPWSASRKIFHFWLVDLGFKQEKKWIWSRNQGWPISNIK